MKNKSKSKKEIEWSKLLTTVISIVCFGISLRCIEGYFSLCKLAILLNSPVMPDATLPVVSITSLLASVLSYLSYQGVLKTSLNKNKLMKDKSGIIRSIKDQDLSLIINATQQENYEEPVEVKN